MKHLEWSREKMHARNVFLTLRDELERNPTEEEYDEAMRPFYLMRARRSLERAKELLAKKCAGATRE